VAPIAPYFNRRNNSPHLSSSIAVVYATSDVFQRSFRNTRKDAIYEAHDGKEAGCLRLRALQEEQDEV
jgi:hypothetical protein